LTLLSALLRSIALAAFLEIGAGLPLAAGAALTRGIHPLIALPLISLSLIPLTLIALPLIALSLLLGIGAAFALTGLLTLLIALIRLIRLICHETSGACEVQAMRPAFVVRVRRISTICAHARAVRTAGVTRQYSTVPARAKPRPRPARLNARLP
jgi:hypothetical protein